MRLITWKWIAVGCAALAAALVVGVLVGRSNPFGAVKVDSTIEVDPVFVSLAPSKTNADFLNLVNKQGLLNTLKDDTFVMQSSATPSEANVVYIVVYDRSGDPSRFKWSKGRLTPAP